MDAGALRAERAAIRTRLNQMAEDEVMGLKTRAQVISATKRGMARMDEIDQLLNATVSDDPLAALVNAPDPVKAWKDSPLANQQVAVDRLCTVTILPVTRRGAGFDPSTVRVDAKHTLGGPALITM